MEPVTTTSPEQAKTDVLARAGASFPKRDTIDTRIVNDVLNKTGHSIVNTDAQPEGAWPVLNSLPAPPDFDHDGMPNDWELANGLDSTDAEDGKIVGPDGYTNLEIYLNSTIEYPTSISAPTKGTVPNEFVLAQNYPNPFNPSTTISFQLQKNSYTTLKIYDLYGREVEVLLNGIQPAGIHKLEFNGSGLSSGVYFVSLRAGSYTKTIKILLTK